MPDILTHRGLGVADAGAITAILASMERSEPVDEAFGEPDVVEEMTAPGVDLDRASVGVLDGGRLVAFGWSRISPPAAEFRAYHWAGVHPDYTGRGIGRTLLAELEDRVVAIRDQDSPGLPGEHKIWVEGDRHRTAALVEAAGYQTWRYFFRMRRDLVEPVRPVPGPAGVRIRPYRPADDEDVRLASNESFADHWGSLPTDAARWRAEYADSASFRPAHSHLALIEGAVVGFVLSSEFEADTAARGYRTGYVARVGTRRSARGRGIAAALLARTLQGMADNGYRYAELGVDADSPTGAGRLYERAGFTTVGGSRAVGRRF